jgi:hypothetical protein
MGFQKEEGKDWWRGKSKVSPSGMIGKKRD